MDNTNLPSVNLGKSLLQNFDFEHNVVQDSDLENLTPEEKKFFLQLARFYITSITEEKRHFIISTSMKVHTAAYQKKIAEFNARKNQVTKSFLVIEHSLMAEKERRRIESASSNRQEQKFTYYFLKTAKENLKEKDFKKIMSLTTQIMPMPETLIGRY